MNIKRIIYIILGFIGVGLGTLGVILPILPTVPFYMLAVYCFARGSERLHKWFVGTRLYKNNLESYVKGEGMTKKTKVKIMVTVTLLMAVGFFMMHNVLIGQIVLAIVWIFHIVYFVFCVKTSEVWDEK